MNEKNEYKKFFDKVSPDQELIDRTKKLMLSELEGNSSSDGIRRFSYKKCGIIAACSAAAAVLIIISPKIFNPVSNDLTYISDNHSAEIAVTSVSETNISDSTESRRDISAAEIVTYASVSETEKNISKATNVTVSSVPDEKNKPSVTAVSSVTVSDEHTNTTAEKAPETKPAVSSEITAAENVITSAAKTESYIHSDQVVVTTAPNFRPGGSASGIVTTINEEKDQSPAVDDSIGGGNSFLVTEYAEYNGKSYELVINQEYDYHVPHLMEKYITSYEEAEEYFGEDFCPGFLNNKYSVPVVYSENKSAPGEGIILLFGEYSDFSDRTPGFAVMSVSDEGTDLSFRPDSLSEMETMELEGKTVIFSRLVQYSNVYFCSMSKGGHQYDFCFKGLTADEILEVLLG